MGPFVLQSDSWTVDQEHSERKEGSRREERELRGGCVTR